MFHGFYSSLARSWYLSLFSLSFNFSQWLAGTVKSPHYSAGSLFLLLTITRSGHYYYYYYYYYLNLYEIFSTVLASGFSLEWKQESSGQNFQKSLKTFLKILIDLNNTVWSRFIFWFSVLLDCSKRANYYRHICHLQSTRWQVLLTNTRCSLLASPNLREFYTSHFLGRILICAYTIFQLGQILISCTIPSGSLFLPGRAYFILSSYQFSLWCKWSLWQYFVLLSKRFTFTFEILEFSQFDASCILTIVFIPIFFCSYYYHYITPWEFLTRQQVSSCL